MREIKFRAWDKKLNKMMPNDYVSIDGNGGVFNNSLENCFSEPKNWILMQYTGLKDKNGKEIYEGDIGKWPSGNKVAIEWDPKRGCYTANFMGNGKGGRWGIVPSLIDIIGNIHENPELLTNK